MKLGCAFLLVIAACAVICAGGCGGANPPAQPDAAVPDANPPDAAAPFLPGWQGQFCAAGGEGVSGGVKGTFCFGPLDLAAQPATSGGARWEPGPIYLVAP